MRLCDGWLVLAVLGTAVFAACGGDSKKTSDGGNPDVQIPDAALADSPLSDVSISPDGADVNPEQADAGAPDLADVDASWPGDVQEADGLPRSGVSLTPSGASLETVTGASSEPFVFHVICAGEIPSVLITGPNKADFSFTTDCDKPLDGSEARTCQVAVVYTPQVAPTSNSAAVLSVVVGDASATATLSGTVVPCEPSAIAATTTDFGSVVVGNTSAEITFTVSNSSDDEIAGPTISGDVDFVIATDNCGGKALPPRTKCTFSAQFKPVAGDAGRIQGQLKATLGTGACSVDLLAVTGVAVAPAKLIANPTALEFGVLSALQEAQPQTLTITNIGGSLTGALKVDKAGAAFTINDDTCTGKGLTASGTTRTCTITLTYTPATLPSEDTGSITVTDVSGAAAEPVTVPLHGQSTLPPTLVLSPSSVCPQSETDDPLCIPSASTNRFSNMPVGQSTPEITFVLSNTTDPVNLPDSGELSFNLEGEAAADFAVTSSTCRDPLISTTVTPPTCSVTLTFKPSAAGLRKAVLKVTTSRGGSAQATLEGKGLT